MGGEANFVYKDTVVITASGAALSTGSVDTETTVSLGRNQHYGYPYVNCVLAISFATAPAEGRVIHLYRHELNLSGTNNAIPPSPAYRHRYMGSFAVKAQTAVQYISLTKIPIEENCTFHIGNDTGQSISAGWSITAQPWTWGPWI